MFRSQTSTTLRRHRRRAVGATLIAAALVAASCGSDDNASPTTDAPAGTEAPAPTDDSPSTPATDASGDTSATGTDAPAATDTDQAEPAPPATDATADGDHAWTSAFADLPAPTGDEIVVGLVNTEGAPGLDFPDIRNDTQATVDYLNEHGGMGNRPIRLETCVANGSPEGSQACAQELTGKNVDFVMLGLDVFPDYATYSAAGTPLIGMLPLTPLDNNAAARYLTGGNATTVGAMAAVAKEHFGATSVGIVSSDNAGANATEAGLTAALDIAGIDHVTVKGGDNETDAGYQGLIRQAADGNPDLLISLYSDAGCIGTIRGRASLGIEIPVVTTSICASNEVIDEVGDDATGWNFVGIATQEDTPELAILQEIVAPVLGVDPADVDSTALGLGGLGLSVMLSIAGYANLLADGGGEVTGQSLYDFIGTSTDLTFWPGTTKIECGAAPSYTAICAFTFPVAAYQEGGEVVTVPGLEAVSSIPYLP